MTPPLSHIQCRERMCCVCHMKIGKAKPISAASELLVRTHGPDKAYDSSNPAYPTGLCASCQRALYKIRSGKPDAGWDGPMPPSWSHITPVGVSGVRRCGSKVDGSDELLLCDICTHVRGNPIGVMGKKVDLNKFHGRVEKVASMTRDSDSKHA